MANFRTLQPAPLDDDAPPQPPQSRPLLMQKPKRTVTLGACVACRKRKSKCDGHRPVCTCCSQKDTECVYELGPNEKPSQAMKRKNEEMQGELSNLRQLYDFLRLRPEHEAMDVLHRIRSNAPDTSPSRRIQELADYVRHTDHFSPRPAHLPPSTFPPDAAKSSITLPPIRLALDAPISSSSSSSSSSSIGRHPLHFPTIMDMRFDGGPPSQRPRYASDVDVSARSDGPDKSNRPISIEAILHPTSSVECRPVAKHVLADPRLASAKHWTTVTSDAGLVTSILSSWTTDEYCYYHYLDRDAFLDDMASRSSNFCSELLVNALLATACATSPAVQERSIPFSEKSIMTAFYREASRLWHLHAAHASLTRIQAAICLYLFLGKSGRDKSAHVFLAEACRMSEELGLFGRPSAHGSQAPFSVPQEKWELVRAVTAWSLFNFQLNMAFTYSFPILLQGIPTVAMPYQDKPVAEALFLSEFCSKENLLCAMMYHVNIISLFQPVLDHGISQNHDSYLQRARSVTSTSLFELQQLLALHTLRHCWGSAIGIVLHPITVASMGSLDEISRAYPNPRDAEKSDSFRSLLICLRALYALSSFCYYAQPLFRLLMQKCQALELRMPEDVQSALDHFTSDEWTRNAANVVSSQYIVDQRQTMTDPESGRMDSVISAWEGLSLEEKAKGKAKLG
ncbi:hypothetical protein ACEQ8H_008737 [Pleosporales sp. CAS-2024a]